MATQLDLWIYFLTQSPLAYFLYFGIFLGYIGASVKENRPRTEDVWIGDRIGDALHIHTTKQVKKGSKSVTWKGQQYPLISESVSIWKRHLAWESPVHIIDSGWASDVLGIKEKYAALDTRTEEDLKKMEKEIEDRKNNKTKGKEPEIKLNINPIFRISAVKLYDWLEGQMLQAGYGALLKDKITANMSKLAAILIVGALLGAMSTYIYTSNQYEPQIQYLQAHQQSTTITNSTTYTNCPTLKLNGSNIQSTSITTTIQSTCIAQIQSSLQSALTSSANSVSSALSRSTSTTVTLQAISSFNNGTIVNEYSNGSRICVHLCK